MFPVFKPVRQALRKLVSSPLLRAIEINLRWYKCKNLPNVTGGRHSLPYPLVVSLTSYPPRFGTLALSLKCLLMQTLKPDQLVLWVADSDYQELPQAVLELQTYGLTIRKCDDIRSYKKLIPQLHDDPAAAIVTADDDVYYGKDWLAELVNAIQPDVKEVLCHRAHRVVYDTASSAPAPYADWEFDTKIRSSSRDIFPTGVGGILYVPGIFHEDVLNKESFMRLCPKGDDIWFFFMAARVGASFRRVSDPKAVVTWYGSQEDALWNDNLGSSGNDVMISAMIEEFGDPWALTHGALTSYENRTP